MTDITPNHPAAEITDEMVLTALNAYHREQYRSWGRVDPETGEVKWEDRTRLDQFGPAVVNKTRAALTAVEGVYREENTCLREDRARAEIDLTDMVERMEALAERLDATARWGVNHPDIDVQAHALADRDLADQIRAILNGGNQ